MYRSTVMYTFVFRYGSEKIVYLPINTYSISFPNLLPRMQTLSAKPLPLYFTWLKLHEYFIMMIHVKLNKSYDVLSLLLKHYHTLVRFPFWLHLPFCHMKSSKVQKYKCQLTTFLY